jgi:hypothetical protein
MKILQLKKLEFFSSKFELCLYLDLHEFFRGLEAFPVALQATGKPPAGSKENIQHFKTIHSFTLLIFLGHFLFAHVDPGPADQNNCGSTTPPIKIK